MTPSKKSPLHILLVEDNPGDARLLTEMLATERPGSFEITHLSRLASALDHLAEGGTDIVLLDLGLPDGDGLDTVRRVRLLAPDVPLIVLTGRDDDEDVAEAMMEGVQDYLVKGQIEKRALPRALHHAIERFRLLRELERRIKEKDVLLDEIHHRVKNSLQIVSSLLGLEAGRITDPVVLDVLKNTQTRVRSMSMIHQTLYQSNEFGKVDFRAFLESFVPTLIQTYSLHPEEISLVVHVAEISLPLDAAIPCGLIVNELISNSLKHAFPGGAGGTISIEFTIDEDGGATLMVNDDGIGIPKNFNFENSGTLGMQLVYLLAGQLGGTVTVNHGTPTKLEVKFPLVAHEENRAGLRSTDEIAV